MNIRRYATPYVVFLLLLASGAVVILAGWPRTRAQNPCPSPIYSSNPVWAWGAAVRYSFDATGAMGVPGNAQPAFTLDANMQAAYANGMTAWNTHSSQNETYVTYTSSGGNRTHTVTAAWPSATLTWTDSAGHTHTQTWTATRPDATAATFYIPDHNASNQSLSTAAAAITLINTNGTYSVNDTTYPMWDPSGANFLNGLTQNGMHETGHGIGLGDRPGGECGNVMSGPLATSQNPTGGTNNNGGCASSTITNCDDQAISGNPNYPFPQCITNTDCPMGFVCTGGGTCEEAACQFDSECPAGQYCSGETGLCEEGGSGCQSNDDCTCGAECMPSGECGWPTVECSPIIIAVGQSSNYQLTSPAGGVWFDLNADGVRERMAWTQAGDPVAFLVLDRNGNVNIDDGTELFGNHSVLPSGQPVTNGFEALAWYDQNMGNGDGVIDSRDAIWSALRLWIDWSHDGVTQDGELYTLDQWQLSSISLQFQTINRQDGYGNVYRLQAPCQFGQKTRFGYDVYFNLKPQKRPN